MDVEPQAEALVPEGFQVRMYRSIRDSGFVPIFPLTALVGRPESGKTSLLRALQGLDPALPLPYSRDEDWPRHERVQPDQEQVVCAVTFRLGESCRERLVGEGAVAAETQGVRLGRTYGGATVVEAWSGEPVERGRANGTPGEAAPEALVAFLRERLPPFLFADPDSLVPKGIAPEDLADPRDRGGESGVPALARLLAAVGLGPEELRGELTQLRVRRAGEQLRELMVRRGVAQDLALDLRRGRVELLLRAGPGRRLSVDKLARVERYRLTLDLRFAAAIEAGGPAPILLLDAPGRVFRRGTRPQMGVMLETYVGAGSTVLYTARLPFDLDLQHSEQVLVLTPAHHGLSVVCPGHEVRDNLAVRAALGMTGRPSFRIAEVNLVVEGATDVWIIGALDQLLLRSGEPALPPGMNLTSVGGSYEVAAVTAFLGRQGLVAIGLVDSDEAGAMAEGEFERTLRSAAPKERVEILRLGLAAGLETTRPTIEDLFPAEFYLAVAREVCGAESGRAIARVERAIRARSEPEQNLVHLLAGAFDAERLRFPKARIAKALEGRVAAMSSVADLPRGMAPRVRRLMEAIRAAAERQGPPASVGDDCDEAASDGGEP